MIAVAPPPENAGYYHAAYIAATAIYALYAVSLWRRWAALRERRSERAAARDSALGTRD